MMLMGFGMLLFWELVILGVLYVAGYLTRNNVHPQRQQSVSEILRERYARGEISKDEFEQVRRVLTRVA